MVPNARRGIFRSNPLFFLLVLGALAVVSGCGSPEPAAPMQDAAADREAISTLLMRQQDAWNAGDIDAFMADYVVSDTLRFTSGGNVRYGWDAAMERYLTTYPDRDAMGQLTFSDIKVDVLSPEWALAFGAWHLKRDGDYADIGGRYTLLMTRTDAGWKVLYDHTSQAD
jgi:ketosteroid isomerase-like protein